MPRIFLSNFHFEYELADARFVPTKKLLEINARNALCWTSLAQAGDLIHLPDISISSTIAQQLQLIAPAVEIIIGDNLPHGDSWQAHPWGWTHNIVTLCQKQHWSYSPAPLDAVKKLNSRRLAFELEAESGLQPQPSRLLNSLDELDDFLTSTPIPRLGWMLKGEFGMSGREKIHLRQHPLNPSQRGWLRSQFDASLYVIAEPFLDRIEEVSSHTHVLADGFQMIGIASLHSDPRGQFQSVDWGTLEEKQARQDAYRHVWTTGNVPLYAQQLGYHGYIGIDMMTYRGDNGEIKIRPLQDINARWTMGMIAFTDWLKRSTGGNETIPPTKQC